MSISVIVIAHNEESWIKRCLDSLMTQSVRPDEIIVLAHNCTDTTIAIASVFPVRIIECTEDGGPIIARARGIEAATGDILCCTDGDCWVDKDWVKNASAPLTKDASISLVAGYTKIKNGWFWSFSCFWQFYINRVLVHSNKHRFAWGSNMTFRKADYEKCGGLLPFLKLHNDLNIHYWAEDLYLSLALQTVGKIYYALGAKIYTYLPSEKASITAQRIIVPHQVEDNKKLFAYFSK